MDEINNQPQVIIQQHSFPKPSMKFMIILFLVLVVAMPVGVYLYVNFSKQETQNLTPAPATTSKPKLTIICPVEEKYCQKAQVIQEGDVYGYGFNLPEGAKIFSVFPGLLTDQPQPEGRSKDQPLLYLTDSSQNAAIYSFYGNVSAQVPQEKVEQGVELGKIGTGSFPPYPPLSGLNFFLVIKDKNGLMLPFETK